MPTFKQWLKKKDSNHLSHTWSISQSPIFGWSEIWPITNARNSCSGQSQLHRWAPLMDLLGRIIVLSRGSRLKGTRFSTLRTCLCNKRIPLLISIPQDWRTLHFYPSHEKSWLSFFNEKQSSFFLFSTRKMLHHTTNTIWLHSPTRSWLSSVGTSRPT